MKEFLVRDSAAFKLRVRISPCLRPEGLQCVEFTGEQYNDKGEMIQDSTYQFFLDHEHLERLAKGLVT